MFIKDKIIYHGGQYIDPYFNSFMNRSIYQPVCYECPFAGVERIGDLTVGDFLGFSEDYIPSVGGHGVNMVLVNNKEGERLLDSIKDRIVKIKRPVEEAIHGNDTLREPTRMPEEYHTLLDRVRDVGYIRGQILRKKSRHCSFAMDKTMDKTIYKKVHSGECAKKA